MQTREHLLTYRAGTPEGDHFAQDMAHSFFLFGECTQGMLLERGHRSSSSFAPLLPFPPYFISFRDPMARLIVA